MHVDPNLPIGIGMSVIGSRDLLNKLLGPTAEYVGGELLNLVKRCNFNVENVFQIALKKVEDRPAIAAVANPRVVHQVIDAAVLCEDPIVAECLGGVLASSRTEDGKDDRGVCFLNDIRSLSNYQLRTHYLIYSALTRFGCPVQTNPTHWYGIRPHETMMVMFSDDSYLSAMGCITPSQKQLIGKHSFLGLQSRNLLRGGVASYVEDQTPSTSTIPPWRFCWPTQYGHELFAWGLGLGDVNLTSYFDVPVSAISDILPSLEVLKVECGEHHFEGHLRNYEDEAAENV